MEVTTMKMAWKEIIKNKSRFIILGSIVFLVSLLTLIISGLSNGLSQDNAALIKDMPEGTFYMNEDADETYNLSKIDQETEDKLTKDNKDRSEEHTSELQSRGHLVCRLLLEKKKQNYNLNYK